MSGYGIPGVPWAEAEIGRWRTAFWVRGQREQAGGPTPRNRGRKTSQATEGLDGAGSLFCHLAGGCQTNSPVTTTVTQGRWVTAGATPQGAEGGTTSPWPRAPAGSALPAPWALLALAGRLQCPQVGTSAGLKTSRGRTRREKSRTWQLDEEEEARLPYLCVDLLIF